MGRRFLFKSSIDLMNTKVPAKPHSPPIPAKSLKDRRRPHARKKSRSRRSHSTSSNSHRATKKRLHRPPASTSGPATAHVDPRLSISRPTNTPTSASGPATFQLDPRLSACTANTPEVKSEPDTGPTDHRSSSSTSVPEMKSEPDYFIDQPISPLTNEHEIKFESDFVPVDQELTSVTNDHDTLPLQSNVDVEPVSFSMPTLIPKPGAAPLEYPSSPLSSKATVPGSTVRVEPLLVSSGGTHAIRSVPATICVYQRPSSSNVTRPNGSSLPTVRVYHRTSSSNIARAVESGSNEIHRYQRASGVASTHTMASASDSFYRRPSSTSKHALCASNNGVCHRPLSSTSARVMMCQPDINRFDYRSSSSRSAPSLVSGRDSVGSCHRSVSSSYVRGMLCEPDRNRDYHRPSWYNARMMMSEREYARLYQRPSSSGNARAMMPGHDYSRAYRRSSSNNARTMMCEPNFGRGHHRSPSATKNRTNKPESDCCRAVYRSSSSKKARTIRPEPEPVDYRQSSTNIRNVGMNVPMQQQQDNEMFDESPRLWKFLYDLLEGENADPKLIIWLDRSTLTFRLVNSQLVSQAWGQRKNKPNMCYESLGRSLRYYYTKNVLEKVESPRLSYRFKKEHLRKYGIDV